LPGHPSSWCKDIDGVQLQVPVGLSLGPKENISMWAPLPIYMLLKRGKHMYFDGYLTTIPRFSSL